MTPCCGCSWALNEQTGAHFCLGCGEPNPSSGTVEKETNMEDALKVSDAQAAKVAVAPRVTLEDLEASIACEYYIRANEAVTTAGGPEDDALACLTICILVSKCGFTVTGESACASPANFNAELGRKFAREQAIRKLWSFEGFALRKRLAEAA